VSSKRRVPSSGTGKATARPLADLSLSTKLALLALLPGAVLIVAGIAMFVRPPVAPDDAGQMVGGAVSLTLGLLLLVLGLLFRRGVLRRVRTLLIHARSLSRDELPPQPLRGRDELAEVDRALIEAGHSLYSAARRESAIFDNVPDIIFAVDSSGKILRMSPACFRITGYRPEDRIGQSLSVCLPAKLRSSVEAFLDRALRGERITDFPLEVFHRDGSVVPIRLSGEWSEAEQCVFCVARDVTEARLAERRLAHLATFPEKNPNPIVEIAVDGRILFANAACHRAFPTLPSLAGEHPLLHGLLPPPRTLVEGSRPSLTRTVQIGDRHHEQLVFLLEGGRILRVYNHDITELKQNEARLRQARDEAEAANRAKSDFLSRMSHELRTPLNSIIGFAQLLQSAPERSLAGKSVEHIVNSGYHLLSLVNDVLDLSKIEAGDMTVHPRSIHCMRLLEEVVAAVRPGAEQREVSVSAEAHDAEPAFVWADETRLRQVLLNLTANAIKYNRAGGWVRLSCQQTAHDTVTFAVQDSGQGIAADHLDDVFQPFRRLESAEVDSEGTGIGLTISRTLVELMGGRITVESELGRGSTFRVFLPVAEPADEEATPSNRVHATPSDVRTVRADLLYVEDNPINLELVEEILQARPGIHLHKATTGAEGLRLVGEVRPDLIVLDIRLPDMDGFGILAQLKKRAETRDIPVLALTAQAMRHDVERGLQLGFRHYITKPISVSGFLHVIDTVLTEQAALRSP
jgi:PAS domain S-box-containing protein